MLIVVLMFSMYVKDSIWMFRFWFNYLFWFYGFFVLFGFFVVFFGILLFLKLIEIYYKLDKVIMEIEKKFEFFYFLIGMVLFMRFFYYEFSE